MHLTPAEAALIEALERARSRALGRRSLLRHLPARDHVLADRRHERQVTIVVTAIRKKLGRDSIETVWGEGYRLGPGLQPKAAP